MLNYSITYSYSDFLLLISFYAAARYILSFALSGRFNIYSLLGKYYEKFLSDLRNSSFRDFYQLFVVPQVVTLGRDQTTVDFGVFENYFNFDSVSDPCLCPKPCRDLCPKPCRNLCPKPCRCPHLCSKPCPHQCPKPCPKPCPHLCPKYDKYESTNDDDNNGRCKIIIRPNFT